MEKASSEDIILYFNKQLEFKSYDFAQVLKDVQKNFRACDVAFLFNYVLKNNSDKKLLSCVIREINTLKYVTNFDELLNFLIKTNDVDLKVLAIKAISVYKNKKAVPVLLDCLKDVNSNYKVRFCSADALGKIGDKTAFESLGFIINNEEEKSTYVKESAVVALGNLGDDRAIDVFSSIMSSGQIFLDKFSYLKERVLEAILKFDVSKDKKAYEILKNSLFDESTQVRICAIESIMNSEIDNAWDLIYDRLLNDVDLEVRKNALIALYNISDFEILNEVINGEFDDELKDLAKEIIQNEKEEDE